MGRLVLRDHRLHPLVGAGRVALGPVPVREFPLARLAPAAGLAAATARAAAAGRHDRGRGHQRSRQGGTCPQRSHDAFSSSRGSFRSVDDISLRELVKAETAYMLSRAETEDEGEMQTFEGQVAVVTGGAAGIGAATARGFAREGATVAILDVDGAGAERLAGEIRDAGAAAAQAVSVDVSDPTAVACAVDAIVAEYGRLDVLHANAGIEWTKTIEDTESGEWSRVIGVNLTGVYACGRAALRVMKARGRGAIVVTASPHATRTVPDAGAYAASKGGALAVTKAMALEAAPTGVRVNAVVPGAIDTPMLRREAAASADPEEQLRRFGAMQPVGRLGRPEEVAEAVLFLASDRAGLITGATLHLDGGQDPA